jgi:anti-sigma B factor antagonist
VSATTSVPTPDARARKAPFRVDVQPDRDVVRVVPIGELDLGTVAQLAAQLQELREVGFKHLVLDLRRVEFIDSSGLHLILQLDSDARKGAYEFAVIAGPPAVQRVFELTGAAEHLRFRRAASADEVDGDGTTGPGHDLRAARDELQFQRYITELRSRPRDRGIARPPGSNLDERRVDDVPAVSQTESVLHLGEAESSAA